MSKTSCHSPRQAVSRFWKVVAVAFRLWQYMLEAVFVLYYCLEAVMDTILRHSLWKGEAMAKAEQLAILKQGVEVWNKWRLNNRTVRIDLSFAKIIGADLH